MYITDVGSKLDLKSWLFSMIQIGWIMYFNIQGRKKKI